MYTCKLHTQWRTKNNPYVNMYNLIKVYVFLNHNEIDQIDTFDSDPFLRSATDSDFPRPVRSVRNNVWWLLRTGRGSDIVKAESSEDPRSTRGLVSNLLLPSAIRGHQKARPTLSYHSGNSYPLRLQKRKGVYGGWEGESGGLQRHSL